jgi:GTP-binding protein Era
VGKSTLLNALVGEHLAAVSPHPQTTRHRILGVVQRPGLQLCLIDSPGVHPAKGLLNRAMVKAALSAVSDVDVVLFLAEAGWPAGEVDATKVDPVGPAQRELLSDLGRSRKPVFLVLTKIDLVPRPLLLPMIQAWSQAFSFKEVVPLSGLTGENVDALVAAVRPYLPAGEPLFPADTWTDQTERAVCSELIREQVFLATREEVPYGTAVTIDTFDETDRGDGADGAPQGTPDAPVRRGLVRIAASILVERDSHKGIIIGTGGQRLRAIGTAARHQMERLLGCKVWLDLHVQVAPGWTEKKSMLAELGYLR